MIKELTNIEPNNTTVINDVETPYAEKIGDIIHLYIGISASSLCVVRLSYNDDYDTYGTCSLEQLTRQQNMYAIHLSMPEFTDQHSSLDFRLSTFAVSATTCGSGAYKTTDFTIKQWLCPSEYYYLYYTTEDGQPITPQYDSRHNTISIGNTTQFGAKYLGTEQSPTAASPNMCRLIFESEPTTIGDNSFDSLQITSIDIPTSIQTIGKEALMYTNISGISIPDSVTSIGDSCFSNCNKLTGITIPNSITTLGKWAFSFCEEIEQITIGSSLSEIKNCTFQYCGSLTGVSIPNNITSIGASAFTQCSAMTILNIGTGVVSIGEHAFSSCSGVTSVVIPNITTSIGNSAFLACRNLVSVTLPNGLLSIGAGAFRWCSALTAITIPDSVTTIGQYAFEQDGSLQKIKIGDSTTTIGSQAFALCTSATEIEIGESVSNISYSGFARCFSVQTIKCKPTTPPTLGIQALQGIPSTAILYVPSGSLSAYQGWAQFTDIRALPGT